MFIVYILPPKLPFAAPAMKTLPEMNSHDVPIDRVFEHGFTSSAPVPLTQILVCAVLSVPLAVPFADVNTDVGFGANDPHPAGVAGLGPVTFVDADHTTTRLASAGVEIVFIDPQPFNVEGTSTLATSAT